MGRFGRIVEEIKWSRAKQLEVSGPTLFGVYRIYVDSKFDVAIFAPKADGTLVVLTGHVVKGHRLLIYDADGDKITDTAIPEGEFEWQIKPDRFLFKTKMAGPQDLSRSARYGPICEGRIVASKDFAGQINEDWIAKTRDKYLSDMQDGTLHEQMAALRQAYLKREEPVLPEAKKGCLLLVFPALMAFLLMGARLLTK